MATYKVKQGMHFGANRQHKPGDKVVLTEAQALPFLDKLEFVSEAGEPESAPKKGDEKEVALADIDGMRQEWVTALNKLEVRTVKELQDRIGSDPDSILAINGIGPATLESFKAAKLTEKVQ